MCHIQRMHLDFDALDTREAYAWMINLIVPRPIAWVSSVSAAGVTNLAPFSFFQGVCANPPILMFVPVNTRDGAKKDTLRNIEAVPEFVVNLVSADLAEEMNQTSAPLPYGVSEFQAVGLASVASVRVRPPRVARARVAFECALHRLVPMAEGPSAGTVVFGRILCAHIHDAVLDGQGHPDAGKLDLVARLGGDDYCTIRDRFRLERPR